MTSKKLQGSILDHAFMLGQRGFAGRVVEESPRTLVSERAARPVLWFQENPKPWLVHQSSTLLSALYCIYTVLATLIRKRVKGGTVGCFLILHCLIIREMLQPIEVTHLQVKIYNRGHKNNGTCETESLELDSMKMIGAVILSVSRLLE